MVAAGDIPVAPFVSGRALASADLLYDPVLGKKTCGAISTRTARYHCAAVRMGEPSGLVAVDVDAPDGRRSHPDQFLEQFGEELESTQSQTTASGNKHYIFRLPRDNPDCLHTTIGVQGMSVDFISDGSVIFAEPCCLESGCYEFDDGFSMDRVADMSAELQAVVCKDKGTAWARKIELDEDGEWKKKKMKNARIDNPYL